MGAWRWTIAALVCGACFALAHVEGVSASLERLSWSGFVALVWIAFASVHACGVCAQRTPAALFALAIAAPFFGVAAALDMARAATAMHVASVLAVSAAALAGLAWCEATRSRTLLDIGVWCALFLAGPALEFVARCAALRSDLPTWIDVGSSVSPLRWAVARCDLSATSWSWRDGAALAGILAWFAWTQRPARAQGAVACSV